MASKKEASIIGAIREMMKNGEPDEKILKTLVEMGVKPEQARRLIMIGQADTLTILQSDIGRIAKGQIENEMPALKRMVENELMKTRKELKKTVKDELDEEMEVFRGHMNEDLKLVNEVTGSLESKLGKIDEKVSDVRGEVKEMQMRRLGTKNEWLSLVLVVGGLAFNAFAFIMLYFIFTSASVTLDSLIMTIVTALTGITMLFGSSII